MRIAIACGLVFGAVALLPQQAAAQFAEKKVLTLEIARKIVATAETEAARNHLAGVVAVVDAGGWPILIERMDHAAYTASVELAPGKGRDQPRSRCCRYGAGLRRDARRASDRGRRRGDRRNRSELRYAGARRANRASRAGGGAPLTGNQAKPAEVEVKNVIR